MNATPSPKTLAPETTAPVAAPVAAPAPEPAPALAPTPTPAPVVTPPPRRRRWGLMVSLPVILAVAGGAFWLNGGRYETTENAYLHQARISIASSIGGRVTSVAITDNQVVHAGDPLFQVDPEPYRLALAQADAALGNARIQVEQLKLAYQQSIAQATLAAEEAQFQQDELTRQQTLSARGVTTDTKLDDTRHAAERAQEQSALAEQSAAIALAALGGDAARDTDLHPAVQSALVARDKAAYDLAQTTVTAPVDGTVYQASSFKPGQMVAAGQSLFALVETGDIWVEANLKETQLGGVHVGQTAEVTFDMVPGTAVPAHIVAIGAGTGAEFSLLPAQNATGNWVKVTQRVPIRIELDQDVTALGIASGMSASVSIDTERTRSLSDLIPAALRGQ